MLGEHAVPEPVEARRRDDRPWHVRCPYQLLGGQLDPRVRQAHLLQSDDRHMQEVTDTLSFRLRVEPASAIDIDVRRRSDQVDRQEVATTRCR